jgi:putative ABC transport system ATP-binding protein/lipoprotein-releasing system ATP-binding protein
MPQVELRSVSREFILDHDVIHAVRDVSVTIEKGDYISIVGHSGSGKTTLLSMIGGILFPSSGSLIYEGTEIYSLNDDELSAYRAGKVGYMFQFSSLMPVLTAKENVMLPSIFVGGKGDSALESKAVELLDLVGIADKAGALPSQLSGGQQRRVAIARALINQPEIILADEPTGDLDVDTEAEVMALLERVNKESGISFVLVTHSLDLARNARRHLVMSDGKLEEKPL